MAVRSTRTRAAKAKPKPAAGEQDAKKLWEHLYALVRSHGVREPVDAAHDLMTLTIGGWTINHWAPAAETEPAELPYGLDVWRGLKVLSVQWSTDGAFKVASFMRGAWEDEALALDGAADLAVERP
jgi:hypothetical protein